MNELFFSALFIGSLLFGNPETKEIPSELNMNQTEFLEPAAKGKIELIADDKDKFEYKVIGDQVNEPLTIYVNEKAQGEMKVGEIFEIKKPENTKAGENIEISLMNKDAEYASHVISF